jgi:hypothetical protein
VRRGAWRSRRSRWSVWRRAVAGNSREPRGGTAEGSNGFADNGPGNREVVRGLSDGRATQPEDVVLAVADFRAVVSGRRFVRLSMPVNEGLWVIGLSLV